MNTRKILYAITVKDVKNVSEELGIDFSDEDIEFIQDKIGDFMGSSWSDAVEFALRELKTRETK